MSNNKSEEGERSSLRASTLTEGHQFIIAMFLISVFFVLLIAHFPSDAQMAQTIFVGFIAWIGAIIGFYFGQRPVKEVAGQLKEQTSKTAEENADMVEAVEISDKLEELLSKYIE